MTNDKLEKIIYREGTEVDGHSGNWRFNFRERTTLVMTDQTANRMRIMTPILEEKEISKSQYKVMLEANFDKALDAKYAVHEGIVWSVYTHPLGELTVEQFRDAVRQVATLADNFGGTYTSTNLVFGGN